VRIDRLELTAFGNFTNKSVDLSSPGLQVIYGPNEAGKTTAREAIFNLLYGFDVRTTYAFVHPMNRLQIGGCLRGNDGHSIEVVRQKRNRDSLLEPPSNKPVSDQDWAVMLQGVGRTEFQAMFTLGWEELVQGTVELVARSGVLGETLFASGLGVRELGAVLENLDEEAGKLFSPRASTRMVNAALKTYADARKAVNDLSVKPTQYVDTQKSYESAFERKVKLSSERTELDRQLDRSMTLRGVLPKLRERAQKVAERTELLSSGAILSSVWAERVQIALASRSELTRQRSEAKKRVEVTAERLADIHIDSALLDIGSRIDALAEGITGYEEGNSDRGGLDEGRQSAERNSLEVLRTIVGGSPRVEDLEGTRSLLADKGSLNAARDEWTIKDAALKQAKITESTTEEEVAEVAAVLGELPEVVDTATLKSTNESISRRGDLDGALISAQSQLRLASVTRLEMAGRLKLSESEIVWATSSPTPSTEGIEEILMHIDDASKQALAAEVRAAESRERLEVLESELKSLTLEGELPTEVDLLLLRQVRETLWSLVRQSWLEHIAISPDHPEFPDSQSLATSYEHAGSDADSTVDQLWKAADRTARRDALTTEINRLNADCSGALDEAKRLHEEAISIYSTWSAEWSDQRLPESPTALRLWMQNFERLETLHSRWTDASTLHREAWSNVRKCRHQLVELLRNLGVVTGNIGGDLSPILIEASEFVAHAERQRAAYDTGKERLATLRRGLPRLTLTVEKSSSEERGAAAKFLSLVAPYGANISSPSDAGVLLERLDELDKQISARDQRLTRIHGIDTRSTRFETVVHELVNLVRDISPGSPADVARNLVQRVKQARGIDSARQALIETQSAAQADVDAADASLTGIHQELELLAKEQGIDDVELLGPHADRAIRLAGLEVEIGDCESVIANQGGGRSIADLESDGSGRDLADINIAIDECQRSRDQTRDLEDLAASEVSAFEQTLRGMDGSDAAADQMETAQFELSRAEEGAHRFVQLLLARYIADEAIRRYRDAHQDPVLERASTYLALLTNGECTKVGVDEDQKKGPLISALYGTGEEKQVLELSSGTRDALYFALRLAAIEESIARIGPMPILLDDVLVNFDDDRSMAALRCLAEIASNTQVLLFTHHRHMISLATEALPPKGYVVHELEKRHAVVSTD
jgi:uncharacterized protein YhaN